MNKVCKKTSKGKILKYIVIVMLCNIAIIMCLGINIKDSKEISKNIIHKEVVDGVEIEILADKGVFPKDAKATIKKLDKQSDTNKVMNAINKCKLASTKNMNSVYSYDITIKDSKGKELQPDTNKGEVIVTFKNIKGLDKGNGESVKVWHVKDDMDEVEEIKDGVEVCKGKVDVKVQHFSIYSIAGIGETTQLEGAGTSDSPYLIKTVEDLIYMRNTINEGVGRETSCVINGTEGNVEAVSAYYKLDDSIDSNGIIIQSDWNSIYDKDVTYNETEGSYNVEPDLEGFQGNFDGNGKKIVLNDSNNYKSLFGIVGKSGIIRNVSVTGQLKYTGNDRIDHIGGIVGLNYGKVQNCTLNNFRVNITRARCFGCIVAYNNGEVSNCKVEYVENNDENNIEVSRQVDKLGGAVGENYKQGKILNIGILKQKIYMMQAGNIGGIVGKNLGEVEACFKKDGAIVFEKVVAVRIGGIIGWMDVGGKAEQIFCNNVDISLKDKSSTKCMAWAHIGGLVGCCENDTKVCGGYYNGNVMETSDRYLMTIFDPTFINIGNIIGSILSPQNNSYVEKLFYMGDTNNNLLIAENNQGNIMETEQLNDIPLLVSKLNASIMSNKWYTDKRYNDGYPIFTKPEPYFVSEGDNIKVYGNGCKMWIGCEENDTVIYWDKNEDGVYDSKVMSSDSIAEATFDNSNHIDIFGGSPGILYFDTNIEMLGGIVDNIYGGGDGEESVVYNTEITIEIQGGTVRDSIDGNGFDNGQVTQCNKVLNISGNPIIGTEDIGGVNLGSFTNNRLIISNKLTGNEGSIRLINDNIEHDTIIATADDESLTENYNVFKVKDLPIDKAIINKDNGIIIVDTFNVALNPLDGPKSIINVIPTLGFGTNAAMKDFLWTGKISAKPSYVLPNEITVKMGENALAVGTDYTWNKQTGEIIIPEVTGNIEVTAQAIYIPPIIYVDKPVVSNTDFTYTGTSQSPVLIDTDKYSVSVTRETNVGEYTMVVSLKDKVYTRWKDGSNEDLYIKWRINKADLQVIANDKSIIYGDIPSNSGVSYVGFVNGEDESVLKGNLSYDYNYTRYDNVGIYLITPKGYEADNYNITYKSGTLNVFPKKLSFNWSSPSEFKYDGKVKMITANIVGIVNNDEVRIASYEHNKTDKVGVYIAKVTGITGAKKDNYTLEGATNLTKKWSIVKEKDKEEDKDKNEDKGNIKDNVEKNDITGSNNNKGNVNNNSSNNTSSNRDSSTDSNKGTSDNNLNDNKNMYDMLAYNNDYKTDTEGAIEGVRTSDNEIKVQLNDDMVITAIGDFEDTVRLMVKEIKNKRKEWRWINSLTKDIGINKGIYDIFFVNSKGVKVNTGRGTKISILSRERLQKADVYYIKSSSENVKIESKKEEYTVKFRMIDNGYYTLLLNDKSTLVEEKDDDVKVVDKESIDKQEEQQNKEEYDNNIDNKLDDGDNIQDGDEQDDTYSKDEAKIDGSQYDAKKSGIQQKETKEEINWVIIVVVSVLIVGILALFVILSRRFKNE